MRSPRMRSAAGVAQDRGRADHVVVVLERLALALEDDAGDGPLRASRRTVSTCSTISQASRLRVKPRRPVSQNAQPSAQPTCDETHTLQRGRSSGMRTASKTWPSPGAEEVLDEGVHLAAPAVGDLQPVEPRVLARRPRAAPSRGPRTSVEVVPVLEEDPAQQATCHAWVEVRPGLEERCGRVAAKVDAPAVGVHAASSHGGEPARSAQ